MHGVLQMQASYLETAGDRCAVLLNSLALQVEDTFFDITIAVIKVMSYLSSHLPYTFILYLNW